MRAPMHAASACAPAVAMLTRVVVDVCRSRTKTSETLFVSFATTFVARLSNATKRPSPEIHGRIDAPLGSGPGVAGRDGASIRPWISGDGRRTVGLGAEDAGAHPRRLRGGDVVEKHVAHAVRIGRHEVRRVAGERDEAAVR